MASFFGFGPTAEMVISLQDADTRDIVNMKSDDGELVPLPLYTGNEPIRGTLHISCPKGKKVDHLGIKIELVGQIEFIYDRSNVYELITIPRELERPGDLTENKVYKFEFAGIEKPNETYYGTNIRLRYYLRAKISRQYAGSVTSISDFAVQNVIAAPEVTNKIKMEVGIEDCLHIEFEYQRNKFHTQDVIIGKIYFLLVRIKIKHMELVLIRRESVGSGASAFNDSENIARYEIMDGAPVRGEIIPIRLYLAPYRLTPTMRNVHNKFSVRYYLNLVLIDEEDRRYFKQQEIQLWRQTMLPDSK